MDTVVLPGREDDDPINPRHYTDMGIYSPVHVVEQWGLGYHLGQTLKYIGRAGKKPGVETLEDLEKAKWYLDRHIENLKKHGTQASTR